MNYKVKRCIKLPAGQFETITGLSGTGCALRCFQNSACNSFDHNEKDSVCTLNSKKFADVAKGEVIADSDFNHYEAEKSKIQGRSQEGGRETLS